jgi:hypothetical protein
MKKLLLITALAIGANTTLNAAAYPINANGTINMMGIIFSPASAEFLNDFLADKNATSKNALSLVIAGKAAWQNLSEEEQLPYKNKAIDYKANELYAEEQSQNPQSQTLNQALFAILMQAQWQQMPDAKKLPYINRARTALGYE